MKMITAIIQPDKLDEVREALLAAEITRITVNRVTGHGREEDTELFRGQKVKPNLLPKIEIKIACNDEFEDIIVKTIMNSAKHGSGAVGDGKIFVQPLEKCYRIRTGESGSGAI
ncbi:MAG TPA: P-II family nitrogen regulator [Leptospiraceae bacterium]|nr:P-II family nitrogen regulator [Leptospiraceae bacterium]HMY66970.1 P-II family nitrogen regulator [Leptospiraceae bacterium]HMZ58433.1 P-II family nitrogen regulator [Leptospiraceae bacterium]HNF13639.1 P-II family nitrogen regulator [Leptospiraceae bacterium]HNF24516.1 P-II family nitrogen regulator [Leptospiraceae bacterium]